MTTPRDPDEILSAWLDEGPTRLPDQTRRAIAVAIPTTTQRRPGWTAPWRYFDMTTAPKFAIAATAVVAVVLGGAFLIKPPASGSGVGGATASPTTALPSVSTSPSPFAAAPIDTSDWVAFSSDRYGYDLSHPSSWTATPATSDWSLEADRTNIQTKAADFIETGTAWVTAFTAPVPPGTSNEDWLAAYTAPDSSGAPTTSCTPIAKFEAITVGGQPGLLNPDACSAAQAFVFIGDRVHVFSVWTNDQLILLKDLLSTVRFRPVAAAPIDTPSPVSTPSDAGVRPGASLIRIAGHDVSVVLPDGLAGWLPADDDADNGIRWGGNDYEFGRTGSRWTSWSLYTPERTYDPVAWLRQLPGLTVLAERDIEVGGQPARLLDVLLPGGEGAFSYEIPVGDSGASSASVDPGGTHNRYVIWQLGNTWMVAQGTAVGLSALETADAPGDPFMQFIADLRLP